MKNNFLKYSLILIISVFIFFLVLEIAQPLFFTRDDNSTYFLPSYTYNWQSLINNHQIPYINFHQYNGTAYLGQGQTAVFYLPIYLSGILSLIIFKNLFFIIDIITILHFLLAAIGMFLLLKHHKCSDKLSFLGSLLWLSFPFILVIARAWIIICYVIAIIPYIFLFLDKLTKKPRLIYALILSFLNALLFYQGNFQYLFILVFLQILFILFKTKPNTQKFHHLLKTIKYYFFSLIILLLLCLPYFLVVFYNQQLSYYRQQKLPILESLSFNLHLIEFIKSQFGQFNNNIIFGVADSNIYFLGLTFLTILLFAIIKLNKKIILLKSNIVYLWLGLISFCLSTYLYSIFYQLPVFSFFRWPFKQFVFFIFFYTLILIIGSNSVIKKTQNYLYRFSLIFLIVTSIFLNLYISITANTLSFYKIDYPVNNILNEYIEPQKGRLFTFNLEGVPREKYNDLYTFNFATLFGYYHFAGYDPLVSKTNYETSLELEYISSYYQVEKFNQEILDYLSQASVKYFIAGNNSTNKNLLAKHSQLELIFQNENLLLYKNNKSLPFVYYSDDPQKKINFEFAINELNIYPNNNEPQELNLTVVPLPKFKIIVDNKKEYAINSNFPIKLQIPANTKNVKLVYKDNLFKIGLIIQITLLFIIALIYLIAKYGRKRIQKTN